MAEEFRSPEPDGTHAWLYWKFVRVHGSTTFGPTAMAMMCERYTKRFMVMQHMDRMPINGRSANG